MQPPAVQQQAIGESRELLVRGLVGACVYQWRGGRRAQVVAQTSLGS